MSGAAHKHLVIILAGSPVTSEYTECTTHDDVLRPSTVTGHTLTALQHTNTQTHKMPFYPFCLCNGPVEGRIESDTDSEEAKGEQDLSTPQTPSTTHI